MKYKHVQQKYRNDCGVACLAMAAQVTYREAEDVLVELEERHGQISNGVTDSHMIDALEFFKLKATPSHQWYPTQPGILIVPSLNLKAKNHYVFWTGGTVLDPQAGRQGMEEYTDEMIHAGAVAASLALLGDEP